MSHAATAELLQDSVLSGPHRVRLEEENSPFGLQGLSRDTLQILKPGCIERLAVTLALRGTRQQIQDKDFVLRQLSFHPDWADEYQVVHLIEQSLWLQGRSDLVMTMTKNPAQIPDNPPPKVLRALSCAYMLHPQATIWYGVPLFSDEKNEDGLPIPVTAAEVRMEAARRIAAAQRNALRWGWLYRAAVSIACLPARSWSFARRVCGGFLLAGQRMVGYWKKARRDVRERTRAAIIAELERCRFGCSQTVIPENSTWLGHGIEAASVVLELLEYQVRIIGYVAPFLSSSITPIAIAAFIPKLIIPLTIIAADPFLFVELPEEPGKLRHIGHWYWQNQPEGEQKLHLHM